jgi:hypothetical protein
MPVLKPTASRSSKPPAGLALGLFGLLSAACSESIRPHVWPVLELEYPVGAEFDYAPMLAQAHAALPLANPSTGEFTGRGRVWIKGSRDLAEARLEGGESIELEPPFYVAVVEADPGATIVEFRGASEPVRVTVDVPDARALGAPKERFGILSYGCFDPFTVIDGVTVVDPGDGTDRAGEKRDHVSRLLAARDLFRRAALGELPDFPAADLILGAGDQVYLEGAHDSYTDYHVRHPLTAWTVEAMPKPRLGLAAFTRFVDETYRMYWSFTTLDDVFRAVPGLMMWDDHEIRDGWGSHGDEHVYVDTYYAVARAGFADHGFARGPRKWEARLEAYDAPLHQSLSLHGLPIFVLDQRSARDVRVPRVLGDEQWAAFSAWLDALDPADSDLYVVVSPLPLLYRLTNLADLAAEFDGEVRDDWLDAWSSDPNVAELDRVMTAMAAAWQRGMHAIIFSGDMHLSALLRADARRGSEEAPEVMAYELVTSGLAGRLSGGG